MLVRRQRELELVRQRYGELEQPDDCSWFVIRRWPLPAGWSKAETALLVLIPPGYPETPPDSFYTDVGLTLPGGGEPANAAGRIDTPGASGASSRGTSWTRASGSPNPKWRMATTSSPSCSVSRSGSRR